jgi:hypothetical protein
MNLAFSILFGVLAVAGWTAAGILAVAFRRSEMRADGCAAREREAATRYAQARDALQTQDAAVESWRARSARMTVPPITKRGAVQRPADVKPPQAQVPKPAPAQVPKPVQAVKPAAPAAPATPVKSGFGALDAKATQLAPPVADDKPDGMSRKAWRKEQRRQGLLNGGGGTH